MLTDIFANRYVDITLWPSFEEKDKRFLVQAFRVISEQLYPPWDHGRENKRSTVAWKSIHDKITMELGLVELASHHSGYWGTMNGNRIWCPVSYSDHDVSRTFMLTVFDGSIPADRFMKERISLIELAFRERHDEILLANEQLPKALIRAQVDDLKVNLRARLNIL